MAILKSAAATSVVGLSSHFADIEDTTDHAFAEAQMARFTSYQELLRRRGLSISWPCT